MLKVFVATVLGFLSGLGTGGGSLLILYLTLLQGMMQTEARAINLMFFIPSALIACLFRRKQGHLQLQKVWPAILAGSLSAALFSWWSNGWDVQLLRKIFGLLMLFIGVKELLYRPKS